jgi:hypothetical protein
MGDKGRDVAAVLSSSQSAEMVVTRGPALDVSIDTAIEPFWVPSGGGCYWRHGSAWPSRGLQPLSHSEVSVEVNKYTCKAHSLERASACTRIIVRVGLAVGDGCNNCTHRPRHCQQHFSYRASFPVDIRTSSDILHLPPLRLLINHNGELDNDRYKLTLQARRYDSTFTRHGERQHRNKLTDPFLRQDNDLLPRG